MFSFVILSYFFLLIPIYLYFLLRAFLLFQAVLRLYHLRYLSLVRLRPSACVLSLRLLWILITPGLRLRPLFVFPPFSRLSSPRSSPPRSVYFAQLLKPTSSFSARARLTVCLSRVPVSSALSYLSSKLPSVTGEPRSTRMRSSRCICEKPLRYTRDACGRISRDATSPSEDAPQHIECH